MDDDDNVNNDDLMLGFCCGGTGRSAFFPWLADYRYERFSAFQAG